MTPQKRIYLKTVELDKARTELIAAEKTTQEMKDVLTEMSGDFSDKYPSIFKALCEGTLDMKIFKTYAETADCVTQQIHGTKKKDGGDDNYKPPDVHYE